MDFSAPTAYRFDMRIVPPIIREVGLLFRWDNRKLWQLEAPRHELTLAELAWHFEVPFFDKADWYDLAPQVVLTRLAEHPLHHRRILNASSAYPIDIVENHGRWLILDGLHRLMKAELEGRQQVSVRIIHRSHLQQIAIDDRLPPPRI